MTKQWQNIFGSFRLRFRFPYEVFIRPFDLSEVPKCILVEGFLQAATGSGGFSTCEKPIFRHLTLESN
jgi:hypothetical protein